MRTTRLMRTALAGAVVAGASALLPPAEAVGGCHAATVVTVGVWISVPPPGAGAGGSATTTCGYRSGGGTVAYTCSAFSVCQVYVNGVQQASCAPGCAGTLTVARCATVQLSVVGTGKGFIHDVNAGLCNPTLT